MSVKVILHKVFDGNKTYEIGDVIVGLSEKDESQLVSDGIVEYETTMLQRKREIKRLIISNTIIGDDIKTDTPLADSIDKKEDTKEENEEDAKEEDQVQTIDPNSFALNPDEYVSSPAAEIKKKK